MSLSKQLYIIISLIFFMIFAGNFLISVKNTKEYLEIESMTKAQDTATSLGMTLKSFMKNKKDPEIEAIIKAIANRGFYKEIRLEDIHFSFTDRELIEASKDIEGINWEVKDVSVDAKYGEIDRGGVDVELGRELAALENDDVVYEETDIYEKTHIFIPNKDFKEGSQAEFKFTALKEGKLINAIAKLTVTKILIKIARKEKFEYVPQWFIDMIPLKMEETKSEINDGWNTTAIIYVSANAGDAYAKLYEQAKGAIIYAAAAFTISIILLIVFLRFILQPLKNIEKLAISIAQGKFEIIKKLPWTTEIKNVSIAMNDMSGKIEGVIKKLNANLENMTKQLSMDDLTGLQLQQTFETDMKKMFISKSTGYIFSVKIDDLGEFAKKQGNKAVDNFLKKFALILQNSSDKVTAYRFYGSEFAMIAENADKSDAKTITQKIQKELEELGSEIGKKEIAHIGATPFNQIGTTPGIVASANEAYEQAKLIGPNEAYIRDDSDLARDMQEWKDLVFDIIDNCKFKVGYIGQAKGLIKPYKNIVLMEEAFTEARDKAGELIPIGTFVSIAEKYDKVLDFDKAVVLKVIEHIKTNHIGHSISINLSLDSVVSYKFRSWLTNTIKQNSSIAKQLVLSVTAYGVAKDVDQFKIFIDAIHNAGAKIIIKRFETKFIPLDNIKDFNLDYIRLARDYTNGIHKDASKKGFVEAMQELAGLLSIKVFAENVKADEDYDVIKALGLYGASR